MFKVKLIYKVVIVLEVTFIMTIDSPRWATSASITKLNEWFSDLLAQHYNIVCNETTQLQMSRKLKVVSHGSLAPDLVTEQGTAAA